LHKSYLVKNGIFISQKFKRFLIAKIEKIRNKNSKGSEIQILLKFQQIPVNMTQTTGQIIRKV
jgi:hypothetical protein